MIDLIILAKTVAGGTASLLVTGGAVYGIYYLVKSLKGTTNEREEHIDHRKLSDIPGCSGGQCSEYCEHVLQCANQYEEHRGLPLECGFMCNDKIKTTLDCNTNKLYTPEAVKA